jgi:hypothetical protein
LLFNKKNLTIFFDFFKIIDIYRKNLHYHQNMKNPNTKKEKK